MDSLNGDRGLLCRVPPFGDLRVEGYLRLTAAFRSLLRPSSAPGAKASSLRSSSLDQQFVASNELCKYHCVIFTPFLALQLTVLFEVILFLLQKIA